MTLAVNGRDMAKLNKPTKHYGKWRIRWTDSDGNRRSEVFENYKEAEYHLRKRLTETVEICRGERQKIRGSAKFTDIADYWLKNRTPLKRNAKDDQSILRCHLLPFFESYLLKDISVEAVDCYVKDKRHLSRKTISNHLTLLIAMLNLARDINWLAKPPRIKKPRTPLFSENYRYFRTENEIKRFLDASKIEGEHIHALFATAVWTGLRAGELAGLNWADVDLERRLITVQRSYFGPTKSGKVRFVPILDVLLPVLRTWRLRCPGEIVFPNQNGKPHGASARVFQEVLSRVLIRAGFPKGYIVFHSCRHTFASHWMMRGGDIFKLQKILGHSSPQMTQRYAHLSPEAFSSDYALFGDPFTENADLIKLHSV